MIEINERLSEELGISGTRVNAAVSLLDEGNTVPFISRYRKEVTGGLDDVTLRKLSARLEQLRALEARKAEVIALIDAQGKLTEELTGQINACETVTEVDDVYRPFRPKRKTRASVARAKGLEPLAEYIYEQRDVYDVSIEEQASGYVKENGAADVKEAIQGACDIIAETISDDADYRKQIRDFTLSFGMLQSRKTEDDPVYEMYADFSQKLEEIQGYRILAINRGEKEEKLKGSVFVETDIILNWLFSQTIKDFKSPAFRYVSYSTCDAYMRLIAPSIEREIRNDIFDKASEDAIKVFSLNLKNLLLQAPVKGKTVMGYDPGYRTGCKLAVVDKTGKPLDTAVIFPTKPRNDTANSKKKVLEFINKYKVDIIAIGNGTAGAESEMFIADVLKEAPGTKYISVSEAGASVYSASELGAEEFPSYDVTERSAVSIGRRLQDPLAELVKIDPKSIGVGQYQHDMKPAVLDEALTGVVEDAVNSVGIDVNTASYSLLSYISGINKQSAKNVVKYREENGEFKSRKEIAKVPRIGSKAFEQCAGFLRVPGSKQPLDNTAVHPEDYTAAEKIIKKFGYADEEESTGLKGLSEKCREYGIEKLADEINVGIPTFRDIVDELEKPGRDVRDSAPAPILRDRVLEISDLKEGMMMTGTVRNVVDFGAFVDIGVHQDGLVHISEISDRFIKHPSEILSVGDVVHVKIKNVDMKKNRIGLTMKF